MYPFFMPRKISLPPTHVTCARGVGRAIKPVAQAGSRGHQSLERGRGCCWEPPAAGKPFIPSDSEVGRRVETYARDAARSFVRSSVRSVVGLPGGGLLGEHRGLAVRAQRGRVV